MSRTLSAATQTEIAKPVTISRVLVQIDFSSTVRWSSRDLVTWNSQSWTPVGVSVSDIRATPDGTISGQLRIANHDYSISAIVLNETAAGQRCQIWLLYGAGPFAVADAENVFDGIVDGFSADSGPFVSLNFVSSGIRVQRSPRVRLGPPWLNHMPPAGQIVTWGESAVRIPSQTETGADRATTQPRPTVEQQNTRLTVSRAPAGSIAQTHTTPLPQTSGPASFSRNTPTRANR